MLNILTGIKKRKIIYKEQNIFLEIFDLWEN